MATGQPPVTMFDPIVIFPWPVSSRVQQPTTSRQTPVTPDQFRAIALSFPEASEGSHFDNADFRVRGRIFATLRAADGRAVLKFTPDEQQLFTATSPGLFEPVKGGWGLKGWTQLMLERADPATVRHTMAAAWRSVAPKSLRK
jgi:hypothetical protein